MYSLPKIRLFLFSVVLLAFPFSVQAQILTGYVEAAPENQPKIEAPLTSYEPAFPQLLTRPVLIPPSRAEEAVDLDADSLVHDEQTQTITASGNVFLTQSGRILRADEIVYDLTTDKVEARGHVVLSELNGDIHYANFVELKDKMKNGFVDGLKTHLNDGSRFIAKDGERIDGQETTMYSAIYTPCEPCKANPEKAPVWQIRASEVTHDSEDRKISYRNARFEAFGVPVAYTPYFSHPDGSIERKSGFLSPSAGFKSRLGYFVKSKYYINIAPDKDATLALMAMTKETPLAFGEYRQRWNDASLTFRAGVTHSERDDQIAGVSVRQDEEVRGHVLAEALWNMNEKWRSGIDIEWASDDQYMRQYDFGNKDVLTSEVYAERFSGRNYVDMHLRAFQDVRVRENQEDQPKVLPEVTASFIGEPGAVPLFKGRWNFEGSGLGLRRDGGGQDVNRLSVKGGWRRRLVSDYGLLTNVSAQARWDFYNARDRDVSTLGSGIDSSTTDTRFFPNLHVESSYPIAKPYQNMQATIEPVVALTIAQNINVNDDIPNEDSQDVQLDASNIFEPNRFPGFDRIEDKSRVTYGVRAGIYGYDGSHVNVFLGQSHRFDEDDDPFPEGSGLNEQDSDVVGQISGRSDVYSLDYRFQLGNHNLSSQRHEVDASADWNKFRLSSRYLFAKALEGTAIDESREQLRADAAYYYNPEWRFRTGAVQDLGDKPGLRRTYLGIDYFGQCISWGLTGQKNFTEDSSGESDTEILFRIGLKNLGEFKESGLRPDRNAAYSP